MIDRYTSTADRPPSSSSDSDDNDDEILKLSEVLSAINVSKHYVSVEKL